VLHPLICVGLITLAACKHAEAPPPRALGAALPLDRIEIVGASVSAGFGGMPFLDAFTAAAKRSHVDGVANVMLFRDPLGDTKRQIDRAIAFRATVVIGLDVLFWDVYGHGELEPALAELERARQTGAWIVIGDVPLITTASEMLLPKEAIPSEPVLAAANDRIRAWATRDRVLLVPLTAWTAPLRSGGTIELRPGERVPAASLMSIDGLHANALGTWYLLDRLDQLIEEKLPGTPKDALVFRR